MAEIQAKPDGDKEIREAFSIFDKHDGIGSLKISEMKHVLERVGDTMSEEDLEKFFSLLDNGSDFTDITEIMRLL
jgi:Ca2+-binding EF-hand superfamily protein